MPLVSHYLKLYEQVSDNVCDCDCLIEVEITVHQGK